MKPSYHEARADVAAVALARVTDADRATLYEALDNEAALVRREEPETDLRLEDVIGVEL